MTPSLQASARPWPPEVCIEVSRGEGDCEDCGGYDYAHAEVCVPGRTLQARYDGHLGGGNWSGDDATLHLWALQCLGVDVRVDGQAQAAAYFDREPGKDWEEVSLCTEAQVTVNILVERAPDPQYPEYETEVAASWTGADGQPKRVETGQGWDGCVSSLYRRLLEERALVRFEEHHNR